MEKAKAARADLRTGHWVIYWPYRAAVNSETIVAEEGTTPQMSSIAQRAKLELEVLRAQAGPPGRSWTLLPAGVSILVVAKDVLTWGILFNLTYCQPAQTFDDLDIEKKRKSKQ